MDACSAFRASDRYGLCKNGFPQRVACWDATPVFGGAWPLPMCMRDEIPERFVTESGAMRFAVN